MTAAKNRVEEATDVGELSTFFKEAWPEDPYAARTETILWRYRRHLADAGSQGVNLVWRVDGRIVGHLGVLPVTVAAASDAITAAWLFDWHVLEAHRGGRGGMLVMKDALSRYPLAMAIGLTEASESIFRRSGWQDAGLVPRWATVFDFGPVVRSRLPRLSKLPGLIPITQFFANRKWKKPMTSSHDIRIAPLGHVPDEASALAAAAIPGHVVRILRDSAYIEARYGQPPPWRSFHFIARWEGRVVGWAAWSLKTRGDKVNVASLLEMHAAGPARDEIKRLLLIASLKIMAREGAHLASICQRGALGVEPIAAQGLVPRAGLRMMWHWREGAEKAPEILRKPENWYVSGGDSDQDR